MHELCAYAQLLAPELTDILRGATEPATGTDPLAGLAAPLSGILVSQIQSLNTPAPATVATGRTRRR